MATPPKVGDNVTVVTKSGRKESGRVTEVDRTDFMIKDDRNIRHKFSANHVTVTLDDDKK